MSNEFTEKIIEYARKLENENKILKDALEFYADEYNWINSECCTGERWLFARQALKELEEQGE